MKTKTKLTSLLSGSALGLALCVAAPVWAGTQDIAASDKQPQQQQQAETRKQVSGSVADEAKAKVEAKRTKLLQEAIDAFKGTSEAITELKNGDKDAALDKLATVAGKLKTVVARDPELALAPVAVDLIIDDTMIDVQMARDIGNRIEDFVDDGEFQEARRLLSDFASELVVRTTNLPLATYSDAVLEATSLIDDGKTDEALEVLDTALSTLVVIDDVVIALPPLRAQAMLDKAKTLLDKGGATAKDDAGLTASDYVAAARTELRLGEALGYGTKRDFRDLHDTLDDLEDAIDDATDTGSIFDRIDDGFAKLRKRLFGAKKS